MTTQAQTAAPAAAPEEVRTGLSAEAFRRSILDNLFYVQGRFPAVATRNDWYMAIALSVRDRVLQRWGATGETYSRRQSRTVCYLSAEFLLGPHLGNTLLNLGVEGEVRQAVADLGLDFDALLDQEEEPGLGNGGLGRLAACFMDSLATLQVPAIGYGIRYEFGIFDQEIRDGWQVERTDKWLRLGNPWEIARPEIAFEVKLGGHTEPGTDERGRYRVRWVPERVVKGVAYDTPMLGYRVNTANLLRLWKAEAVESFDFDAFNTGDYFGAVDEKIFSETISKVLYPNDEPGLGKMLRLAQQYFFVSCSLRDMIRILFQADARIEGFADKYAVQMNDTHPSLAVAELMRLLVDDHGLDWGSAWDLTRRALRLHQPYAAAGGSGEVDGGAVRPGLATSPGDRVRDQPALPGGCAHALSGRRGACRAPVADRRERAALRAHGSSRRVSAATRSMVWLRCIPSCSSATRCATSSSCRRRNSATRPMASRRAASWASSTRASRRCSPRRSALDG